MLAATKYVSYAGIRIGMITLCVGLAILAYAGKVDRLKRNAYGMFWTSMLLLTTSGFLLLL